MTVRALAPLSARAADANLIEYTLTAAPLQFSPGIGDAFAGVGYNGGIPGPVLRLRRGQRVRATFLNRTGESSTIHWHGMILPNAMDGVPDVTQAPVADGARFEYEFEPAPSGTRWYHSHSSLQAIRGLVGMFVVDDPADEPADQDIALVFHDVPVMSTVEAALKGTSHAPMVDPSGSAELLAMSPDDEMGDEVAYSAHCINGAAYPKGKPVLVRVGQKIRLRILNANLTQTRYIRLGGHSLRVTHSDGNPLPNAVDVDVLRVGIGERYDAWFEVTKPGAWLLQGLSADPMAFEQAVVIHTADMENASPQSAPNSLESARVFSYEMAGALAPAGATRASEKIDVRAAYVLDGGKFGSDRWTMNGKVYPDTERILVKPGNRVEVRFTNKTDMHHPMHLHGHVFEVVAVGDRPLRTPLHKDTALVDPNGGTMTWRFTADSPAGRWLLHCHNDIHMMDGLTTEVDYT